MNQVIIISNKMSKPVFPLRNCLLVATGEQEQGGSRLHFGMSLLSYYFQGLKLHKSTTNSRGLNHPDIYGVKSYYA